MIGTLHELMALSHETASKMGWYRPGYNVGERLNFIHEEVSELGDALRHTNLQSPHILGFSAAEEEAADVLINLLSFSQEKQLRLTGALLAKLAYIEANSLRYTSGNPKDILKEKLDDPTTP